MTLQADNVIEAKGALILGAGAAGLFTALKLSPYPALVLADTHPGISGSSARAQGGIAADRAAKPMHRAAVGPGDRRHGAGAGPALGRPGETGGPN